MGNNYEDKYSNLEEIGGLMVKTIRQYLNRPAVVVWGFLDEKGGTHVSGAIDGGGQEVNYDDIDRLCYRMTVDGLRRVSDGDADFELEDGDIPVTFTQ